MSLNKLKIEIQLNREISSLLNEKITFNEFLNNRMLIIRAIKSGIPSSLFRLIQVYTPFTEKDWTIFLDISKKTLLRYKMDSFFTFKPIQSERIIEILEVTKIGLQVFGSMEKLKIWLRTPNYALGNGIPFEVIKTSYGKELVTGELIRIGHGIFI